MPDPLEDSIFYLYIPDGIFDKPGNRLILLQHSRSWQLVWRSGLGLRWRDNSEDCNEASAIVLFGEHLLQRLVCPEDHGCDIYVRHNLPRRVLFEMRQVLDVPFRAGYRRPCQAFALKPDS